MNSEPNDKAEKLYEAAKNSKAKVQHKVLQGYYADALQQFEELLTLQKRNFPMNSKQLSQTVEEIIIVSNILGMIHLKKG